MRTPPAVRVAAYVAASVLAVLFLLPFYVIVRNAFSTQTWITAPQWHWLPNALERADRMWLRHKLYSGLDDVLPSEVFRRNMYLCMIEEPVCLRYRDDIGIDRIMWECDYPHTDTVWPESQDIALSVFTEAGCTEAEMAAIAHGNAERVFNWKMAVLPG